jgi:hypothetical protein
MNDKIGFEEYMMEHLMLKTQENYGRPNKVVEYANPLNKNGKIKWGCGYWWRF